ncbi:MAG: hypothetical protein L0241_13930 [Planctomycetia bacterium]|nr:hypothetical protein [Planctomycetia bacterium]
MPASDDWTDSDFVPREPDAASESPDSPGHAHRERMEWCRLEILSRLGAGETQVQVTNWLVTLGCDPGEAIRLVAWAQTAAPLRPPGGDVVVCVEEQYESGEVNTDPVASARARAAARKQRTGTTRDTSAPEFEFAQPADSTQARLNHKSGRSRIWLVALLVLLVCTIVVVILAL